MQRVIAFVLLSLLWAASARAGGLEFAEQMRGHGVWNGEYRMLQFDLSVRIDDVDAWRADSTRLAQVHGTLRIDQQAPVAVVGDLQVLSTAPGITGRLLVYRLSASSVRFFGLKHVVDGDGPDLLDDVTTLHGRLLPANAGWPTYASVIAGDWSAAIRFEWWRPSTVAAFLDSFRTIDTPWYDRLRVRWVFIRTAFGSVASEFFGGLF